MALVLLGLFVLFIIALVFIDRRLNPSVDAPELLPIELPRGQALPPDTVLFDSDATGTFEVMVMGLDGTGQRALTDDDRFDSWWARLSPDRRTVLFYRTPAGVHDLDFTKTSLWMVAADGGDPVEVLPIGSHGWNQHGHAEWSPDGTQLVMFGGKNTNPRIHVTSADGRTTTEIVSQEGTNIDPSWSPDGTKIVYVGCPGRVCFPTDQEIYVVPAAGGERVRLTNDDVRDHDPYFSPDGERIAMLTEVEQPKASAVVGVWDIRVTGANGGVVERLIGDQQINSMPKWADNDSIWFHRFDYTNPDAGFDLWKVTVSTKQTAVVLATDANEEYPEPN